ncbi:MAG: hypothetical protein Q9184_005643 [Pyrenodesmia sp. 2 TL-2023]
MDPRISQPHRHTSYASGDHYPNYIPTNRHTVANDMAANKPPALVFRGSIQVRRRSRFQSPKSGPDDGDLDSHLGSFETNDFDLKASGLDDLDGYIIEDNSDIDDDDDGDRDSLPESHRTQQAISRLFHARTGFRHSPMHAGYPRLGTVVPRRSNQYLSDNITDNTIPSTGPVYPHRRSSAIHINLSHNPPPITRYAIPSTIDDSPTPHNHPSPFPAPYYGHGDRTHITPQYWPRRRGGVSHPPRPTRQLRYPSFLASPDAERDSEADLLADEEAVQRVRRRCAEGGRARRAVFSEVRY